jgi:hypothetical protein
MFAERDVYMVALRKRLAANEEEISRLAEIVHTRQEMR